ncbi:MAG: hypothetical protein IPN11_00795 [Opitutaceae bacterium]|nr:hypothetical protein [Opitutaceae bacterium]
MIGAVLVLGLAATALANPALAGRWRFEPALSTALDGWHKMDLVVALEGTKVALTHDMLWIRSKVVATNTFDTAQPVEQKDFFRIEQRHMAVYPEKHGVTKATASWIDGGRVLRTEAMTPVEVSQGNVLMRITTEYRVSETGDTLTLIELHSTRNRPLVYVFKKVPAEAAVN